MGINLAACPHQDTAAWSVSKNTEENVSWWGERFEMQVQGILNTGPVTPTDRTYDLRVLQRHCPDFIDPTDWVFDGSCYIANEWDVHLRLVRDGGAVRLEQTVTSPDGGPLDSGFQFTWD
ncbi:MULTISPECIES: hypothetical protein [Streptomyces]|uniref:Uncharacterized protein n=1 Tax=Streptomyces dengpaensis TaxID=2049881 RepID=A0ABM6SLV9_9ACTN|nr:MULTISPECIES: hypothetical protein [Streptomyces]AVH55312.1 hypothetical protein C4B68_05370 [Streptomyces dengpaensis]PIB06957.1 hypothetical protein B1C81_21525 [Streptomyces sp. HG99]